MRLCREAVADGFTTIKLKVGADTGDDRRRLALVREAVGPDVAIAVDANQRWSVPEAIAAIGELREFDLHWVEEPTHPDDVVGHATIAKAVHPVPIATGEMLASPTLAKQLIQLGGVQILQIDATRMAGVHDLLAAILMAAGAGVDVIPHAGGVGLCEAVQHFAFFNAICVAADTRDLSLEYVDHLHEHLTDPVEVTAGRYHLPTRPGRQHSLPARHRSDLRLPHRHRMGGLTRVARSAPTHSDNRSSPAQRYRGGISRISAPADRARSAVRS